MTCVMLAAPTAYASDTPLELYPKDASDRCIAGSRQIRVTIEGVTKVGIMKLELYDQEDGFLMKKARRRWIRDAAQDGPQMMCVNVPSVGEYAISGYHDIDGNRKLKKTWKFRPREPFGLSNNPPIGIQCLNLKIRPFMWAKLVLTLSLNSLIIKSSKKRERQTKS